MLHKIYHLKHLQVYSTVVLTICIFLYNTSLELEHHAKLKFNYLSNSSFLPFPIPWQLPFYFWFNYCDYFFFFYNSYNWYPSILFICLFHVANILKIHHAAVYVRISFFLMLNSIPLNIYTTLYLFICPWAFRLSWISWIML